MAEWFPLLTAPSSYVDEAEFIRRELVATSSIPVSEVLELGSGGGNNAFHLKQHFRLTLTDLSAEMLNVSRQLNPDCEHVQGDMRTVRLGRRFDAVLVHDAVAYLTEEDDLRAAAETAFAHLRPGGAALVAPDDVRETFVPRTRHGAQDAHDGRGLRYVEWTTDPDPDDTSYTVDFAYLLRERDGSVRVEHDRHSCGLFARNHWLRLLTEAGFDVRSLTDPWARDIFLAHGHA